MLSYTYSKKQNRLLISKRSRTLRLVVAIALVLTILSIFIQLYTMSIFAIKGEQISVLESKKEQLVKENKVLKDNIANVRSIDSLDQNSKELGYVDIDYSQVKYLMVEN